MTPKEKAQDLIDKYLLTENEYKEHCDLIQAKQCALIAVGEMIKHTHFLDPNQEAYTFWLEVKQEIEKL